MCMSDAFWRIASIKILFTKRTTGVSTSASLAPGILESSPAMLSRLSSWFRSASSELMPLTMSRMTLLSRSTSTRMASTPKPVWKMKASSPVISAGSDTARKTFESRWKSGSTSWVSKNRVSTKSNGRWLRSNAARSISGMPDSSEAQHSNRPRSISGWARASRKKEWRFFCEASWISRERSRVTNWRSTTRRASPLKVAPLTAIEYAAWLFSITRIWWCRPGEKAS